MKRPFLFMSGESMVSLGSVFTQDNWNHTMSASKLVFEGGVLRRQIFPTEQIDGVIHYADVDDKELEKSNLNIIKSNNIPCWPDPEKLLKMLDRHALLRECDLYGVFRHRIFQDVEYRGQLPMPFVLKVGNSHRGIGKYLINSLSDIPEWDGIATMEPFFDGTSIRVLIIDNDVFGLRIENKNSWIKNTAGADVFKISLNNKIIEHAISVKDIFKLDIAGIDYILEPNGEFHFLEINQYPGVGAFDDIQKAAKLLFIKKMKQVESLAYKHE